MSSDWEGGAKPRVALVLSVVIICPSLFLFCKMTKRRRHPGPQGSLCGRPGSAHWRKRPSGPGLPCSAPPPPQTSPRWWAPSRRPCPGPHRRPRPPAGPLGRTPARPARASTGSSSEPTPSRLRSSSSSARSWWPCTGTWRPVCTPSARPWQSWPAASARCARR